MTAVRICPGLHFDLPQLRNGRVLQGEIARNSTLPDSKMGAVGFGQGSGACRCARNRRWKARSTGPSDGDSRGEG